MPVFTLALAVGLVGIPLGCEFDDAHGDEYWAHRHGYLEIRQAVEELRGSASNELRLEMNTWPSRYSCIWVVERSAGDATVLTVKDGRVRQKRLRAEHWQQVLDDVARLTMSGLHDFEIRGFEDPSYYAINLCLSGDVVSFGYRGAPWELVVGREVERPSREEASVIQLLWDLGGW